MKKVTLSVLFTGQKGLIFVLHYRLCRSGFFFSLNTLRSFFLPFPVLAVLKKETAITKVL